MPGAEHHRDRLFGLVLAGGKSRRMGEDKAMLIYDGQKQIHRMYYLLRTFCTQVYVSLRADQIHLPGYADLPQLPDLPDYAEAGPLSGILSALTQVPDQPWLIVACDLPFVTEATVRNLIENRRAERIATAYRNEDFGFPEPLCAIYEPQSRGILESAYHNKTFCPREILSASAPHVLDVPERGALSNVNTRDERHLAEQRIKEQNGKDYGAPQDR